MYKFITIIFTAFICSISCHNHVKFNPEYDFYISGSIDSAVSINLINRHFNIKGLSIFDFNWANIVEPTAFKSADVYTFDDVPFSNCYDVEDSAIRISEWLERKIVVEEFKGYYDIYIKGYVKDNISDLKFKINCRITNLPGIKVPSIKIKRTHRCSSGGCGSISSIDAGSFGGIMIH